MNTQVYLAPFAQFFIQIIQQGVPGQQVLLCFDLVTIQPVCTLLT